MRILKIPKAILTLISKVPLLKFKAKRTLYPALLETSCCRCFEYWPFQNWVAEGEKGKNFPIRKYIYQNSESNRRCNKNFDSKVPVLKLNWALKEVLSTSQDRKNLFYDKVLNF